MPYARTMRQFPEREMPQRARRIFLGTLEIAGFYGLVTKGLQELGVDCSFVELSPHPFQYRGAEARMPFGVRLVRRLANLRLALLGTSLVHRSLRKVLFYFESVLRILIVLPWAAARFAIF